MRRTVWAYAVVAFLCAFAGSAQAIDLKWSSGADSLSFTAATRCTLVVRSTGGETDFPKDLRLAWVVGNGNVVFVPAGSGGTGPDGAAVVTEIGPPSTAEDILGHVVVATMHVPSGQSQSEAIYVVDLSAGSRGKFQAVALDPSDPESTTVLESPVVTFNGGLDDEFPPDVLRTTTTHNATTFSMVAVGAHLGAAEGVSLEDPAGVWEENVLVTSSGDNYISATGQLAASVPSCLITVATPTGLSAAAVPADEPPPPLDPESSTCQARFIEQRPGFLQNEIQPRDFALVPGGWTPNGTWSIHMFYGRLNKTTRAGSGEQFTEKNFGHVATQNLNFWPGTDTTTSNEIGFFDTSSVVASQHGFDNAHVYAPCIVRSGLKYYMYYAGEDSVGNQALGLATSNDLRTWVQQSQAIMTWDPSGRNTLGSWAVPTGIAGTAPSQLRDPYVIPDPDPALAGHWLLYYVTIPRDYPNSLVVGVSHSIGTDITAWDGGAPLYATLHPKPAVGQARDESPAVLQFQNKWWIFYTPQQTGQIYGVANAASPSDTVVANWSVPDSLDGLIVDAVTNSPSGDYARWHALEFMPIASGAAFIAGWDDLNVSIDYVSVTPWSSPALFRERCPISNTGVDPAALSRRGPSLERLGASPTGRLVTVAASLPARAPADVAVYDAAGRKLDTIFDGYLPAGTSALTWNGLSSRGERVGRGVYFVSMTTGGVRRTVRAVWLP